MVPTGVTNTFLTSERGKPLYCSKKWPKISGPKVFVIERCSTIYQCGLCISYNMGKRDLPDIYALARGPQARGHGHIFRQIMSGRVISNICHFCALIVRGRALSSSNPFEQWFHYIYSGTYYILLWV